MEPTQGYYAPSGANLAGGQVQRFDRRQTGRDDLSMQSDAGYYSYHPVDLPLAPTYGMNNLQGGPPMGFPGPFMPPFAPAVAPSMDMMHGGIMTAPNPLWMPPAPGNFLMTPDNMFNRNAIFGPVSPVLASEPAVPFDPSSEPPFIDRTEFHRPRPHGVMKIKNIPYALTVSEVQQFICKYMHISDLIKPHQDGFPIHIIMERSTGKTMDCYIETVSPEVALEAWERGFSYGPCRFSKLGQRHVVVEMSTQGELMRDLFPRARSVAWDNEAFGTPRLIQTADAYSSGFAGFFTAEEMAGIVRHAENPQRSPFASRSLQRTYESTISTLYKFPWSSTSMYTMKQRDILFKTYARQLEILIFKVERETASGTDREVGLDIKLLMDFLFAGMNCPGFSERQKAAIADASHSVGPGFRTSVHARNWAFQALGANPSTLSDQDIGMWFEILNLGMVAMERENREFIGIHPNLEVVRDDKGYVLFKYTDQGAELARDVYARLEKDFMREMMHKGWASYMDQAGISPPPDFEEYYAQALTDDRYDSADEKAKMVDKHVDIAQVKAEATNKQLASFLELLKVTHGEDYVREMGSQDANLNLTGQDRGGFKSNPAAQHSHRQSLSLMSEPGDKKPSLNSPLETEAKQSWNQQQRHASDSALETAMSALDMNTSPPRISTARKDSPVRQGMSKAPATEGSGLTLFKVPRRERQAVSIRAPDGTPVTFARPSEAGNAAERDLNTPHVSSSTTPATGSPPTSTPATPRQPGFGNVNFNHANMNPGVVGNMPMNPVVMPQVGRPSPGHTRNYGMSSAFNFVASSPVAGRAGHGTRMVADSGSPLARGTGGGSGSALGPGINLNGDPFRAGPRGRAPRSTFTPGAAINEEEFEEPDARSGRRD